MEQDLFDRFIEEIQPLAEKIGQGAEFLWEVSYRQVVLEGILYLIGSAFLFVAAFIAYKVGKSFAGNAKTHDGETISKTISYVLIVLSVAISVALLADGVLRIANPGYYAIETLMKTLGIK